MPTPRNFLAYPGFGRSAFIREVAEASESRLKPFDDDGKTTVTLIYYQKQLKIHASTPGEIVQEAQAHFRTSQGITDVAYIGDTWVVGNKEGLELFRATAGNLEQRTSARMPSNERITHMEEMIQRLEERDRITADLVLRLQERIRVLESQSDFRALARMRYISTFKRDHLPGEYNITHPDHECIMDGNSPAHDADPIGDAELYREGKRSDEGAFKALYGLSPLRAFSLKHHESIMDALCAYAELAKKGALSGNLNSLFAELVSTINLRGNKWVDAQLGDPASTVCGLLRAVNAEVRLLRGAPERICN